MPQRTTGLAATALVLLLALTGCGETATDQPEGQARAASESAETTAPLVAEEPSAATAEDQEAAFLDEVRDRLSKIRTQIPNVTDAQLLDSARTACARLDAGESGENMTLIEDEQLTNGYYMDSGAIIIAARLTMCPIDESTSDDAE